jgi:hypothetical protein
MSTLTRQIELPDTVRQVLQRARQGVRIYVWLDGLARLVILLGAVFWVGLLLDWLFEPSPAVRRVALVAVAVAGVVMLYRLVFRRVFVSLPDASLAMLLERRFAQLNEHLLTTVHLASPGADLSGYHPELVSRTQAAAQEAIRGIHPKDLFHRGPLVRAIVVAAALVVSIVAFSVLSGETFAFWMSRIRLSPELWPRRVHLEVVGFPADAAGQRIHKLAQDDDFELLVHASTHDFVAPDEVEIRFRLADGRRGRDTMIRVGQAVPGKDDFQLFRYQFKHVAASMSFDVLGGDDRVRNLQLQVVDRPELFAMEIECVYPPYLGRPPARLPVTGGMRIPEGTQVTLHASSTKPLTNVRIHTSRDAEDAELKQSDQPRDELSWSYGVLSADEVLQVHVTDVDGVANRDPYRVSLSVVPDELPQIAVRLDGIGTAVTPEAVIPLAGKITDDYGLDRVWFEYQVDGGPVEQRPFARQPDGTQSVSHLDSFDTRALNEQTGQRILRLRPGQKLFLSVKAADRYDLADVPRAGSSQQFGLEVVTVAQLLALLEHRELSLRQRYEAIYEKMTDTRNLLGRVDFNAAPEAADTDSSAAAEDVSAAAPADGSDRDSAARRALARRQLRIAGSLQNVDQAANEILGIAESFDDMVNQLNNNRIDNPDLEGRLHDRIAEPLHRIGKIRMPQWEAQLQLVQQHVEDPAAAAPALAASIATADQILVEMHQVLDSMLELENYNEVLSLLREIISDQEQINQKTKERQKERLENLLEK